jgi:integrase
VQGDRLGAAENNKARAAILAQLLRADLLPEAQLAPAEVRQLRALLRHRASLVPTRGSRRCGRCPGSAAAAGWTGTLPPAACAGSPQPLIQAGRAHPHMLRHTFVTTSFDAGVDLRDVQIAARHADLRTTMRYDRARQNLDRHPNYILAAFMASGA